MLCPWRLRTGSFYFPNGDGTPMSALFPFGYGLSYTTFAVANGAIGGLGSLVNGTGLAAVHATITVDVTNTGPVAASVPSELRSQRSPRARARWEPISRNPSRHPVAWCALAEMRARDSVQIVTQ